MRQGSGGTELSSSPSSPPSSLLSSSQLEAQREEVSLLYQTLWRFQALHGFAPDDKSVTGSVHDKIEYLRQQLQARSTATATGARPHMHTRQTGRAMHAARPNGSRTPSRGRCALQAVEALEISSALEANASQRLLEQLSSLDGSMGAMQRSLESVAAAAAEEDAEAAEFARFKQMLQELQLAVQAAQSGGNGDGSPQAIKSSAAFKQAGAMLRGWIEQFESSTPVRGFN